MRFVLAWVGLALLVAPANADWLVLHDGSRVETAGPWKTKGRQVVFTRAGGSLSALRLADVDLEASAAATAMASKAKAAALAEDDAPEPRRQSVLVLTDKDIRAAADDLEELGEGEAENEEAENDEAEPQPEAEDTPDEPVVLMSWESRESSEVDGLELIGSVRNTGSDIAAALQVKVRLSDRDGKALLDTRAFLQNSSLAPGQSTTFRALLPGVYTLLVDPVFQVGSEGFSVSGPRRPEDDAAAEDEGSETGGASS